MCKGDMAVCMICLVKDLHWALVFSSVESTPKFNFCHFIFLPYMKAYRAPHAVKNGQIRFGCMKEVALSWRSCPSL